MEISLEEIAELLKFIATLDCASVELTVGDVHLEVRRRGAEGASTSTVLPGTVAPLATSAGESKADRAADSDVPVASAASKDGELGEEWYEREARGEVVLLRSPMVGTVYRCKEPGAPPFVRVGDRVSDGDVLCLVEVMKLFHSLSAETDGVVEEIFVDDGAFVEFSQPLMAIATS